MPRRLWCVAGALPLLVLGLRGLDWKSVPELHTLAEAIAGTAALATAWLALVRYYARREIRYLLVGTGFLGAFLLDTFHIAVTSTFLGGYAPSILKVLTPWSGAASSLFLSLLMLASVFYRHEGEPTTGTTNQPAVGPMGWTRRREIPVYLSVFTWMFISFCFFATVPLQPPYWPHRLVHHPAELIPSALFAVVAYGCLVRGNRKRDPFERWLGLSLITACASHFALSVHAAPFDFTFFLAHLLKIAQYLLALGGLYAGMYAVVRREAHMARRMGVVGESLTNEIRQRRRLEHELQKAQQQLETRVRQRTEELKAANEMLSAEIAGRKRAEEELANANAQLNRRADDLERQTNEMQLFAQLGTALRACTDAREAEATVAKVLALAFPHCSGAVYIVNSSSNLLQPVETLGCPVDLPSFAPDQCCAVRMGNVHFADGGQLLDCAHVGAYKFYICAPMIAQGETLGTIFLHAETPAALMNSTFVHGPDHIARGIAARAAMALNNLRLRQVLRDAAIRDPLTGLFNRRYMEETFARELARCTRNGLPLSLLMVDIDHFKSFNDRYGHDVGDLVLKNAGLLLKSVIRAEDVVCRMGGEEFVILMPGADLQCALQRAREMRMQFDSICVTHRGVSTDPVTISVGVANTAYDGNSMEELLLAADHYLYAAKNAGRNRVCANPLGTTPGETCDDTPPPLLASPAAGPALSPKP